jgi:polyvinyl alcohol dehydrogenase (cytochrome)
MSAIGVGPGVLTLLALGLAVGIEAQPPHDWTMGGQNLSNTRHQAAERRLHPASVSSLTPRWIFTTGGDVSATPAVAGGAVYIPDWGGNLSKIQATTGRLMWTRRIEEYTSDPRSVSRTTPAVSGSALFLGTLRGAHMLGVGAGTGELIWKTQLDDHPVAIVTQSPVVYQQRVYVGVSSDEELLAGLTVGYRCCTFRGSVVALDARTGSILWRTYMTPDNFGVAGGYAGVSVWGSTPVVDPARNSLYVTTGNNYNVPPEVKACEQARRADPSLPSCSARDNHVDAVVALDLDTGAVKWSTTIEGYDAWTVACVGIGSLRRNCPDPRGEDYDFGQGPMLLDVPGASGARQILGVGQKSGIFWALDPDTGAIRWSTVVGPAGLLGGMQWGSATDGHRIYVAVTNTDRKPYTLEPSTCARSRPRASTSCARWWPSSSGRSCSTRSARTRRCCCGWRRRRSIPGPSRSRCCTSTRPTSSAR